MLAGSKKDGGGGHVGGQGHQRSTSQSGEQYVPILAVS